MREGRKEDEGSRGSGLVRFVPDGRTFQVWLGALLHEVVGIAEEAHQLRHVSLVRNLIGRHRDA